MGGTILQKGGEMLGQAGLYEIPGRVAYPVGGRKPVANEKSSRPFETVDIFSLEQRDGPNDASSWRVYRKQCEALFYGAEIN